MLRRGSLFELVAPALDDFFGSDHPVGSTRSSRPLICLTLGFHGWRRSRPRPPHARSLTNHSFLKADVLQIHKLLKTCGVTPDAGFRTPRLGTLPKRASVL